MCLCKPLHACGAILSPLVEGIDRERERHIYIYTHTRTNNQSHSSLAAGGVGGVCVGLHQNLT